MEGQGFGVAGRGGEGKEGEDGVECEVGGRVGFEVQVVLKEGRVASLFLDFFSSVVWLDK